MAAPPAMAESEIPVNKTITLEKLAKTKTTSFIGIGYTEKMKDTVITDRSRIDVLRLPYPSGNEFNKKEVSIVCMIV